MEIMISYAEADKRIAIEIIKYFQSNDVNMWVDFIDQAPSQSYEQYLHEAMYNCDAMVFVLTPNTLANKRAELDIKKAQAHGRPILVFKLANIMLPHGLSELIEECQQLEGFKHTWSEALSKMMYKLNDII